MSLSASQFETWDLRPHQAAEAPVACPTYATPTWTSIHIHISSSNSPKSPNLQPPKPKYFGVIFGQGHNLRPELLQSALQGHLSFIMDQQHIDELLVRYLGLLDEYTRLRESLSKLQTGIYQNIARANFSGERGMRYGQDHYDERMQALRLLHVEVDENGLPAFAMADAPKEEEDVPKEDDAAVEQVEKDSDSQAEKQDSAAKKSKIKNPIHWFGLFAPMPLRTAQTQSIQAVEQIIPRLVSVNAEMLNVEIEVRRARKRRAKAVAAAEKNKDGVQAVTGDTELKVASVDAA